MPVRALAKTTLKWLAHCRSLIKNQANANDPPTTYSGWAANLGRDFFRLRSGHFHLPPAAR
jgi:hypothetical protein